MSIEWHQVEDFFASQDGHFIRVTHMAMGPGFAATMRHLDNRGEIETIAIAHGQPFDTVAEAKEVAEHFLADHLATPEAARAARLLELQACRAEDDPYLSAEGLKKLQEAGFNTPHPSHDHHAD